jgi:hypothetical protein
MRDDPDFGKRISKKVQEIKHDKENLLQVADEYGQKYQQEIIDGTKKRQRLLENGASRGLTEAEVMGEYGRFVPTVYTPILNFLYFMLRETEDVDRGKYRQRDAINEALVKAGQLSHDDREADLSSEDLSALIDDKLKELKEEQLVDERRRQINDQFLAEEKEDAKLKDTPDMVGFLYGNITLDMFNKIKKLKALSKSPHEGEAFAAYRKALELCKEYQLDFDRILCYVKGKDE